MPKAKKTKAASSQPSAVSPDLAATFTPAGNTSVIPTQGPQFADPTATPNPSKFTVRHASDTAAYTILDKIKNPQPKPFPPVAGTAEPVLTLAQAIGRQGATVTAAIAATGQIVFHSVGDTGNTSGPKDEDSVADKMLSDYTEQSPRDIPSFFYHLGDVVYSFGESAYYYDQFYDPYRDYPGPVFAIPGNHDGMVAPYSQTQSLAAFRANFCAPSFYKTPEAGDLSRTAQIQPGVYFTFEAPFVRILGLYSNCLEDPGIISSQSGAYPGIADVQIDFLKAALARIKTQKFTGAVIVAVHHPPYVVVNPASKTPTGHHTSNKAMLADIDAACVASGVWPHAVFSGHAHNYQRFTRHKDGRETPFIVAGNGGHKVNALTKKGTTALRTPLDQPTQSDGKDQVVFESYDDQQFGYLRVVVNSAQLHIEYHPASDGQAVKTSDDSVTVDLKTRTRVPYKPAMS